MNQHPKFKQIVATGQIGNPPSVHIWNAVTKETLSILRGEHSKGICSVDFSCTGKYVVSVGLEHNVTVWRWQEGGLHLQSILLPMNICIWFWALVARWAELSHTDLVVPCCFPLEREIFSTINMASLHTAFHYYAPIVLIFLKYC